MPKMAKTHIGTLYSFIFLHKNVIFWRWPFSPCFDMESPRYKGQVMGLWTLAKVLGTSGFFCVSVSVCFGISATICTPRDILYLLYAQFFCYKTFNEIPNKKKIWKLHYWFKSYNSIMRWIANGWILPSGWISLGRVCYIYKFPYFHSGLEKRPFWMRIVPTVSHTTINPRKWLQVQSTVQYSDILYIFVSQQSTDVLYICTVQWSIVQMYSAEDSTSEVYKSTDVHYRSLADYSAVQGNVVQMYYTEVLQ